MLTAILKPLANPQGLTQSLSNVIVHNTSPYRTRFALAYLKLFLLRRSASFFRSKTKSFKFLGRDIFFENLDTFNYVFNEVFVNEAYLYPGLDNPRLIIDCGSNIGISVMYFNLLFPDSRIVAFEAFPETFALLKKNLSYPEFGKVTMHNKALSGSDGTCEFFSEPGSLLGSLNPQRGKGGGVEVESVRLSTYITGEVDLLKIDIEGAEIDVFRELEKSQKLKLIKRMIIEYHHQLPGSPSLLSEFLGRLEANGFHYELDAALPKKTGLFQDIVIRARQ